jgi:hypothetical protein
VSSTNELIYDSPLGFCRAACPPTPTETHKPTCGLNLPLIFLLTILFVCSNQRGCPPPLNVSSKIIMTTPELISQLEWGWRSIIA